MAGATEALPVYLILVNGNVVAPIVRPFNLSRSLHELGFKIFDLICRRHFDFRLPLVKFDCAGNADDFPLERVDSLVSRHL